MMYKNEKKKNYVLFWRYFSGMEGRVESNWEIKKIIAKMQKGKDEYLEQNSLTKSLLEIRIV